MYPKTPSIGRLLAVAALLAVPWRAGAQESAWTADEAVRRALANPEVQGILDDLDPS